MYAIETPYALALTYKRTADAAIKTRILTLMDALWVQRTCNANPQYVADYDTTCGGFGFNFTVVPGSNTGTPKYIGQGFGVGNTTAVFGMLYQPSSRHPTHGGSTEGSQRTEAKRGRR